MGFQNREIETKLVVLDEDYSLVDTAKAVRKQIGYTVTRTLVGKSADVYWKVPKDAKADFARLRYNPNGSGQLTVKHQDKGRVTNRVEIDVHLTTKHEVKQGRAFMERLLGQPVGTVVKKYYVYFLENEDTTVSVYQVEGDSRVFVEAEAKTEERMSELLSIVDSLPFDVRTVPKSLYRLMILEKLSAKRRPKKKAA